MIGKFLNDSLDALLDGLAKLGLVRGGAAWTRRRWQAEREAREAQAEQRRRSVAASHRMCRDCRALVPNNLPTCPSCGASMHGIPRGGTGRALAGIVPAGLNVSMTLLGSIVVLYLISALAGDHGSLFSPDGLMLQRYGVRNTALILQGDWWRLITPIFFHGSLMHILFNGMSLSNLGPFIEEEIGGRRFIFVYMTTGIFSFVVSALLSPHTTSLGASGAIFGLIGFGIGYGKRSGGVRWKGVTDQLLRWAVFGLLMVLAPGIDHFAHAGGFVSGLALGFMIRDPRLATPTSDRLWSWAALIAAWLPISALIAAVLQR